MDMTSSERAYPTQQDLQVFSTSIRISGLLGNGCFRAVEANTRLPEGSRRRGGREAVLPGHFGARAGAGVVDADDAGFAPAAGSLAPTARMRTLIQLPTGEVAEDHLGLWARDDGEGDLNKRGRVCAGAGCFDFMEAGLGDAGSAGADLAGEPGVFHEDAGGHSCYG